jgi:hypothetical protein
MAYKEAHQTFDVAFAVQPDTTTIVLHGEGFRSEPNVDAPGMTLLVLVNRVSHQSSSE